MITDLPLYVYVVFFIAVAFALAMFYKASNKSGRFVLGAIIWGILHSSLAASGFYENTTSVPPRFLLIGFPLVFIIMLTIFSRKMKDWLGSFDLKLLTYLHIVRVPVELVLFWLFVGTYVPELITFMGSNHDIIIGFTAPLIALISYRKKITHYLILFVWNCFSILLLFNVVYHALLSVPTSIQQFAFDQPNVAVVSFPFVLLPTIIVPLVLISIMAAFVIIARRNN